jgi:hypothetical protein
MKDLRKFIKTTIREFLNENTNIENTELLKRKLLFHLAGGNIKDSVDNIEIFINYFNGYIPNELKYEGTLYRIVQTQSKELYNKFLKQGFNSLPLQKYYACSKTMNGIEEVKQKTLKNRYKYYVVFKFDVTFDDVLFDINKLIDYVGLDENRFKGEEEVLVLSNKIPTISKNNIIDYGIY